jgi:hypothetical protein
MTTPPPQPPEGALLELTRKRRVPKMSVAAAAQLAGISETRWRQIENGYMVPSAGTYAPVTAPADTLAKMVHAVGATPEQLRRAERDDAADAYERIIGMAGDAPEVEINDLSQDADWADFEAVVQGTPASLRAVGLKAARDVYDAAVRAYDEALRQSSAARSGSPKDDA